MLQNENDLHRFPLFVLIASFLAMRFSAQLGVFLPNRKPNWGGRHAQRHHSRTSTKLVKPLSFPAWPLNSRSDWPRRTIPS
jgi:hypothetical protein